MMRGRNETFSAVKNALEHISRARKNGKPRIIVCTTISNINYNHLENMVKFLKGYPIDAIYPRILVEFSEENINNSMINGISPEPYFTSTDGRSHLLNKEEVGVLRGTVKGIKNFKEQSGIFINFRSIDMAGDETFTRGIRSIRKCNVCTTLCTIDPYGNIAPCPMYDKYHLGNLLVNKMEDVWGNEKHLDFVETQRRKRIAICSNCSLNEYYPSFSDTLSYYSKKIRNRCMENYA
jgi:radical SAM protein with 4Fe4S-binding SPASM domain